MRKVRKGGVGSGNKMDGWVGSKEGEGNRLGKRDEGWGVGLVRKSLRENEEEKVLERERRGESLLQNSVGTFSLLNAPK